MDEITAVPVVFMLYCTLIVSADVIKQWPHWLLLWVYERSVTRPVSLLVKYFRYATFEFATHMLGSLPIAKTCNFGKAKI